MWNKINLMCDLYAQIERVPRLVNLTRISIVGALLLFHTLALMVVSGIFPNVPFFAWVFVYGAIILISKYRPNWQFQSERLPSAIAVVDITMIMVLVYLSGGVSTGFGILVLPFIATSCLLSHGRFGLLYSTYTTMLIVLMLFINKRISLDTDTWQLPVVGSALMLIVAVYGVGFLMSASAVQLEKSAKAAHTHKIAYNQASGLTQLVLNQVQEAVVVIDDDQTVRLLNKKARFFFSQLRIDKREKMFDQLIEQWKRYPEEPFEANVQLFKLDMHVRAIPMIQEQTSLLMLFIRSMSEISAESLSAKLAALGQLTANLAHEIRNPMSAIRHANDLMQESVDDPFLQKLHGIIDNNIQRIDKMLEDVSIINKKDKTRPELVNLMKFWLEFKREFILNNADAIGCIRMHMDGSNLTAYTDPHHLQQIMWNLCNNAWRHSRKNKYAVTVLMRPHKRGNISIIVTDNGSGVPYEIRSRLFDPFFTTEKQGTGLGLYVARELAQVNKGTLHYLSEINGFEVILPKEIPHDTE